MRTRQGVYLNGGKRLLDLVVSVTGLVALAPLLVLLALVVRVVIGGPVLFRQPRGGRYEQPFTMFKFRSMTNECDSSGNLLPDDMRMTRLGWFLRSTSLDELPELFNILKGEMSLVGPRPLLTRYHSWYRPGERARFHIRPGITGWAQVNGRNSLGWDKRFQYDVEYVERCTFALDVKILFRTVGLVLRKENIHFDPNVTPGALDDERRAMQITNNTSPVDEQQPSMPTAPRRKVASA